MFCDKRFPCFLRTYLRNCKQLRKKSYRSVQNFSLKHTVSASAGRGTQSQNDLTEAEKFELETSSAGLPSNSILSTSNLDDPG